MVQGVEKVSAPLQATHAYRETSTAMLFAVIFCAIFADIGFFLSEYIDGVKSSLKMLRSYALVNAPFDINQITLNVIKFFTSGAEQGGNTVSASLLDQPLVLLGDQQRFRQMLSNLLGNAIKFTKDGQISVKIERIDHQGYRDGTGHRGGTGQANGWRYWSTKHRGTGLNILVHVCNADCRTVGFIRQLSKRPLLSAKIPPTSSRENTLTPQGTKVHKFKALPKLC
jgi:hypothetical protein